MAIAPGDTRDAPRLRRSKPTFPQIWEGTISAPVEENQGKRKQAERPRYRLLGMLIQRSGGVSDHADGVIEREILANKVGLSFAARRLVFGSAASSRWAGARKEVLRGCRASL